MKAYTKPQTMVIDIKVESPLLGNSSGVEDKVQNEFNVDDASYSRSSSPWDEEE